MDVDRSGSNIWHAPTSGGTTVLAKVLSTCSAAPTNSFAKGGPGTEKHLLPGELDNVLLIDIVVWIVELGVQNTPLPSNCAVGKTEKKLMDIYACPVQSVVR